MKIIDKRKGFFLIWTNREEKEKFHKTIKMSAERECDEQKISLAWRLHHSGLTMETTARL